MNKITIIGLLVLDQDAAIEFYTQKLAFRTPRGQSLRRKPLGHDRVAEPA
jgi:catechol 2,3-dioxygenase-like lactoylglutathione lyase family enzyme